MSDYFEECEMCKAKPGMPVLCPSCLHNRKLIDSLQKRLMTLDTKLNIIINVAKVL